ncbi:MAG TPA: IS66 family transposase [Candidatus Baltobacteraceae bacterium]|nr:IS66 family transposase [Candidatus Baltobacteraceae bacterium]
MTAPPIDRTHLPSDPVVLQQLVRDLLDERDAQARQVARLQHWLTTLLRARYGPARERVDEHQLFLFAAAALAAHKDGPPPEPPPPPAEPTPRRGHGRQRLPKHLERRQVTYDLPTEDQHCPTCQAPLTRIGDEVSERLEYVPASLLVLEEHCAKYACPKGCTVRTAIKPMQPIEKGLPGPGLLAQVAVSKYADHLPLHRQTQQFARQGVTLSRQTLCDWMGRAARLVAPLVTLMQQQVLASKVLQTDDTPVAVLDPTLPRTKTGRIWTYVGDGQHPYTVYDYTPDRSRAGPDQFLEPFNGYLQADAYAGYDALYRDPARGITEVACWAHSRRRVFEARDADPMRAMILLAYIRLLYDVEREARDLCLDAANRRALRQVRSVPILADIEAYLRREQPHVLPKSPIGEAIAYALHNWAALVRYTEDGDLAIDNNAAERSLRGVAVGRKNWMFFGSDTGGRTAAILTSLITTCKRLHVEPFAYLRDVFERISGHPASRLADLLPDRWQAARTAPAAD